MKFERRNSIIIYSWDCDTFYDIEGKEIAYDYLKAILRYGLAHPGAVTIKIHSNTLHNEITNSNVELIDMTKGD